MNKQLVLVAAALLGFTSCGSSGGVKATATRGDAFCKLAETADDDNNALDALDGSDVTEIKLMLGAAIDSLSAVVAKAPKDIVDTAKALLSKEEELEKLLKANDYDVNKMAETEEGKKLLEDDTASKAGDDFEKYLNDKCGIEPSDTSPDDTTPVDTPDDTSAAGSLDTLVDFGEGEEAINTFLDYYELGTGVTLTSDQRSCVVSELVDKVTGTDLNQAAAGNPSPELTQALGLAFVNCKILSQS